MLIQSHVGGYVLTAITRTFGTRHQHGLDVLYIVRADNHDLRLPINGAFVDPSLRLSVDLCGVERLFDFEGLLRSLDKFGQDGCPTLSIARRSKADIGIIVRFDISLSFARLSGSI